MEEQGAWTPSGVHPMAPSTALVRLVSNTRVSCGVVAPDGRFVALPIDTKATRLPSGDRAMSTASTIPASAGPLATVPSGANAVTAGWRIELQGLVPP